MEIPLFQDDVPLRFERIVLYPYPDLKRIWTRVWLTAVQDQRPNLEVKLLNPDGTENNSVYMLSQDEQRIETTLHMRKSIPGSVYHVIAELSVGLSAVPQLLDRREFDMVLEFRNPETPEPGFGIGVDWDALREESRELGV